MSGTPEEYEALTEMFEDKIMEMIRRRVRLHIFKSGSGGKLDLQFQLTDVGREGNQMQPFDFMPSSITISVDTITRVG